MCWRESKVRQDRVRVPETGDLVRGSLVKRVQAPRLAELTALQGRGGVLAFWLLCSLLCSSHASLVADWSPPTKTPSCNKHPIHHAVDLLTTP